MTAITTVITAIELYKSLDSLFSNKENQTDQKLDDIANEIQNLRNRQEDILDELFTTREKVLKLQALEARQLATTAISNIRRFENGEQSDPSAAQNAISFAVAKLQDIDVRQQFLAVEVGGLVAMAYLDITNAASDRGFARQDIASEVNAIASYFDRIVSVVRSEVTAQRNQVEAQRVDIGFSSNVIERFGQNAEIFYRATLRIDGRTVEQFSDFYVGREADAARTIQREAERAFASEVDAFLRSVVPFPDVSDLTNSAATLRALTVGEDARGRFNNGDNAVTLGSGNDYADGLNGDDQIFGGAGNDALRGGEENDSLFGQSGDDVLNGQAGNDLLAGGTGSNVLRGGDGFDIASYRDAAAGVRVSLLAVNEQSTGVSLDLIEDVEGIEGSNFSDVLTGDTRANTLIGLAGNDQLFGGRGADRLIGGSGRDLLYGHQDGDTFVISSSDAQGGPTTLVDLSFAEGDRIEFSGFGALRSVASLAELAQAGDALGFTFVAGPGTGSTVLLSNGASLIALPTIRFSDLQAVLQSPPDARNDGARLNEDSSFVTIDALANDADPNPSDVLSVTSVDLSGTKGSVTNNGDGTFTYRPNGQFETLAQGQIGTDQFSYTISDGRGGSDTAMVSIVIDGVNDAPEGRNDSYSGFFEDRLEVSAAQGVLANDSDIDNSSGLRALLNAGPQNGSLVLQSDGRFTYTPAAGFSGQDQFTYILSDGIDAAAEPLTVTITVGEDLAQDDHYSMTDEALESFGEAGIRLGARADNTGLLDNDTGLTSVTAVNGAPFVPGQWFDGEGGGQFRLFSDGEFEFRNLGTDAGLSGMTGFEYTATDGITSDKAQVRLEINTQSNPAVDDDAAKSATEIFEGDSSFTRLGAFSDNTRLLNNDIADEILFVEGKPIAPGQWFDGDGGGQFRVFSRGVLDFRNEGDQITAGDVTGFDYAVITNGLLDSARFTFVVEDFV